MQFKFGVIWNINAAGPTVEARPKAPMWVKGHAGLLKYVWIFAGWIQKACLYMFPYGGSSYKLSLPPTWAFPWALARAFAGYTNRAQTAQFSAWFINKMLYALAMQHTWLSDRRKVDCQWTAQLIVVAIRTTVTSKYMNWRYPWCSGKCFTLLALVINWGP